jgi:hypothetical protein
MRCTGILRSMVPHPVGTWCSTCDVTHKINGARAFATEAFAAWLPTLLALGHAQASKAEVGVARAVATGVGAGASPGSRKARRRCRRCRSVRGVLGGVKRGLALQV